QNTSRKNGKSSRYNNTVRTPFLSPTHQYMTNKVAEKQAAKSRQVNSCKAVQKPKATKTKTYSYKNFWNRKDGFFSGRWWQDPDKMDEAYRMLQEELRAKRRINLVDLSVNNESLKLLFLQELVNGNVKDGYGDALLNAMQNGLVAVGLDASPYEISPRSLYELKKRYDKNPYKNANHAMQNGWGDIALGAIVGIYGITSAVINGTTYIQKGSQNEQIKGDIVDTKPYAHSRPSFRKGIVEKVWENAKGPDGLVRDPHTGEVINWTPGQPRKGVWDMGHIAEAKYSVIHKAYMNGEMTTKEFVDWYNDPSNYRPEIPSNNRNHKYE
ncbi:HNH/ENDO VII family nuclease, partial [Lacrimispora saccharolytica]|nr:HNH/ENDO VII family nuclease [Lacrimispora saccharolytica]